MTEDEFAAYQSLNEETEDHRWAFGTGFTDPLEGIDASVPDGVDAAALTAYCLALGDDALIYSHRLQQWMTRMPELEEETALANIALDLLGQARMLLARAGQAEGRGRREDDLAFFRDEHEFRNVRLAEHTDADFAQLAGRLLVFSAWRLALFGRLAASADPVLAAIAAKGANELAYHRDYAAQWVIRLGDGTPLSHDKMAGRPRRHLAADRRALPGRPGGGPAARGGGRPGGAAGRGRRRARRRARRGHPGPPAGRPARPGGGQSRARRRAHRTVRLPARRAAERRPRPSGRDMVTAAGLAAARAVAAAVPDPELPMVTVADLGILRDVATEGERLVVTITPTYSGCPALREIAHDLRRRLAASGFAEVDVRTALAPAWSSDWITAEGRRKLSAAGIAPPHAAPARSGPVPLTLTRREPVACPRCGSADTTQTAAFGATACKALFRCESCREPFEHVKAI